MMGLRTCTCCGLAKPYDPSAKKGTKARGFHGTRCWDCYKESARLSVSTYRSTPEGLAAKKTAMQRWLDKPGSRETEVQRSLAWKKANPGIANANNAKYRAAIRQRTMKWTEHDAIKALYQEANAIGQQVDHGFPIQADWVSGLHVLANLRILTRPANIHKSNKRDLEWERSLGYHVD